MRQILTKGAAFQWSVRLDLRKSKDNNLLQWLRTNALLCHHGNALISTLARAHPHPLTHTHPHAHTHAYTDTHTHTHTHFLALFSSLFVRRFFFRKLVEFLFKVAEVISGGKLDDVIIW